MDFGWLRDELFNFACIFVLLLEFIIVETWVRIGNSITFLYVYSICFHPTKWTYDELVM